MESRVDLLCWLPFIVILFLALPLLLDPGAVDRILKSRAGRRPPSHPPGYHNRKEVKKEVKRKR